MRRSKVVSGVLFAVAGVAVACGTPAPGHDAERAAEVSEARSALGKAVETEAWYPLTSPTYRSSTAMVFDQLRGEGVLFGESSNDDRDTTWIWNGNLFREHPRRRGVSGPEGRSGHALAWDPVRQVVVLFGGTLISGARSDETWTWNGRNWTAVVSEPHPSPRSLASLIWDDERKNLVLYGGQTEKELSSETWTFDGRRWALRQTGLPPQRFGTAMAWDPIRKTVVLVGGTLADTLGDTWTWNGTEWRIFTGLGPTPRASAKLVWDGGSQALLLFGGSSRSGAALADSALFDGKKWSSVAGAQPPARFDASMAFDASHQQVVLHGGARSDGVALADTWFFSGGSWTQGPQITPHRNAALTWDERRKELVLFGSSFGDDGPVVNGYAWDGMKWSPIFSSSAPSSRGQVGSAYDEERKELVVFGGYSRGFPSAETWMWNGRAWKQAAFVGLPSAWPSARAQASMAWDAKRKTVLLFGGRGQSGVTADTWTWDGTRFTDKTGGVGALSPSARSGAVMGYDPKTERVMLVGGLGMFSTFGDAWSYDGANWRSEPVEASMLGVSVMALDEERQTLVAIAPNATFRYDGTTWRRTLGPTGMYDPTLTWDPIRKNLVLIGGTNTRLAEVWTWDGATWTKRAAGATNVPASRNRHKAAWDPVRGAVIVHGGSGLDDTWAFDGSSWSLVAPSANPLDPYPKGVASFLYWRSNETRNTLHFDTDDNETLRQLSWSFHTRGRACTSNEQCASNFCVDGVCCEQAACGTCETCAAPTEPGRCSPITRAEDADSCPSAEGKTCNEDGACTRMNGAKCSVAADCLSGFCVQPFASLPNAGPNEGICCNRPCDGVCEACAAGLKLSQKDDGTCDVANVGTNPNLRCQGSSSCNSKGVCGPEPKSYCKDVFTLVDESGAERSCGRYRCEKGACLSRCNSDAQCGLARSCSVDGYCDLLLDSGCSARPRSADAETTRETDAPLLIGLSAFLGLLVARGRAKRSTRSAGPGSD
ncbi:MAG: kelch repeat-containing protein [Polyangiaceae bacterium]